MPLLRQGLEAYYTPLRGDRIAQNAAFQARRAAIWEAMDRFDAAHPGLHPCLLKARLHEEIAERCEPVLFAGCPFFFEMGVRQAENWGTPHDQGAASWLYTRRAGLWQDMPEWAAMRACTSGNQTHRINLWVNWRPVDCDHHSLGYERLLQIGIDGVLAEIAQRRAEAVDTGQAAFLDAAARSCRALLRIAERFAEAASARLAIETDPETRRHLLLVAAAARRVPAAPPRTFHEGLAAILFLREAVASLEGVGISVLGRPDLLLGGIYRADLAAGRLDEAGARDLLARWMPYTDIKFHLDDNPWPETSTCITLGGCDGDGQPAWNEVTRLIIEVHRDQGLANPKLNCRFDARSPAAYLDLLSTTVLGGHNHVALINDDVLIPALIGSGKSEREARGYVNGGCQETIAEGVEHSAPAYFYLNLARVLDLVLQPREVGASDLPDGVAGMLPQPITDADAPTFESFYARFLATLEQVVTAGCGWLRTPGQRWPEVHPCPLFSSTIDGCIENAADYTAGSARHNPSGLAMVGLATVVDSLWAIREAVYGQGWTTLAGLRAALAADWRGHEELHRRCIGLGKFGHDRRDVDALAARFCSDAVAIGRRQRNERGGTLEPSFFVYYFYSMLAHEVRATPDGRRAGALLSQGVAPGRVRPSGDLPGMFHSLSRLGLDRLPGNAVLDIQLPLGATMPPPVFSACMRTFATLGGATLQPNCVSAAALRDAQRDPAAHRDLMVRISGLSARFVALRREVQDEIIARTMVA